MPPIAPAPNGALKLLGEVERKVAASPWTAEGVALT